MIDEFKHFSIMKRNKMSMMKRKRQIFECDNLKTVDCINKSIKQHEIKPKQALNVTKKIK